MIKSSILEKWYFTGDNRKKHSVTSIFDVEYAHIKLGNEDDFYITSEGLPVLEKVNPSDFRSGSEWFKAHAERLAGTSCVYKIKTREIDGKQHKLVIKWNRMGEDVPGAEAYEELLQARFNSPFEEFGLVNELRRIVRRSSKAINIQKPLAIYVPYERYKLWQTGRSEYKMKMIMNNHEEVRLDMNRMYMVIYEWVEGQDAAQAYEAGTIDSEQARMLAGNAAGHLEELGYIVRDNKPNHVIIDPQQWAGKGSGNDQDRFAYIDFELLERTQEHQARYKVEIREHYHKHQKDRFTIDVPASIQPHLEHVNIFDVDYIYGNVESTKGRLWVVGKDPYLFDFFLPERWEKTKRTKISMFSESYYTVTKDDIHIVWEVSKVGLVPDMDPFLEDELKVLDHGYNSPFEEVSLAIELNKKGLSTIYPRAIYMMGNKTEIIERFFDNNRYESHARLTDSKGNPVLKKNRNYIIIWGYWNGPDERLARDQDDVIEGINMLYAYREGILSRDEYMRLLRTVKDKLCGIGVEDLNLSGKHLLVSVNHAREIIRDENHHPDIRICNFEFLKRFGKTCSS